MNAAQDARNSAVEDTFQSMVVEASAGTGKTSTLIGRILHSVLKSGPDGPPLPLGRICAITFTEKAAGEMKIRLRYELEKASASQGAGGERARQALRDLDAAAISTFHAFAVSLLKERPFEAGLDPHFAALDEVQGGIFFREVWEAWLPQAIHGRHPVLEEALRNGIRLDHLRDLADILRLHAREVRELQLQPPLTDEQWRVASGELMKKGKELADLASDSADKLLARLNGALDWLAEPQKHQPPSKPGRAGSVRHWKGGDPTLGMVRDFIREAVAFGETRDQLPRRRIADRLVRWMIADFLPHWESCKRSRGLLDFDDQLRVARDLLRSSRAARGEFQKNHRALLVDEFQDTDPLQLELLLLLTCTDLDQTDPARLKPSPGRLFLVGDPKQSIYRFRGADIETYQEVVDAERIAELGLAKVELTTNMRSVPSILRFVDSAFENVMVRPANGRYQPDYLAFGGAGLRSREPEPPSVYLLSELDGEGRITGSGSDYFEREAGRIAKIIAKICGHSSWAIEDSSARAHGRPEGRRAPRYGDIAILLPVLTHVDTLEEALRAAGIPYVLEGGKFYYMRSEVSSAITVLRAVANPNDRVALYGALRSIFFGLSDEDLLSAHVAGIALDYRSDVPAESPLARPYRLLRGLHAQRYRRSAAETFELLLRETGAREVLAPRGFQSIANLGKLGRTLRSLQQDLTFSEVVDLVGLMDEEGAAERESRLMEEHGDAVRIMSIHKSKGLDFSIVFAAGLGAQRRWRPPAFLADAHERRQFALRIGSVEGRLQTAGWEDLVEHEKPRETEEVVRLLYVALTRARDRLIVCTHHKGNSGADTDCWEADLKGTHLERLSDFLCGKDLVKEGLVRLLDTREIDASPLQPAQRAQGTSRDWPARLRRETGELQKLISETPFSVTRRAAAQPEEELPVEGKPLTAAQERAVRLGIAFHEAMEGVDLRDGRNIRRCAERAGLRHQLDAGSIREVTEMMRLCLEAPLMQRARTAAAAGRRLWRELPFVRPMGEGKIDLLFEEESGWVLVDYKTDRIAVLTPEAEVELRSRYGPQMEAYRAVLSSLGVTVKACYLFLARTGAAIEIPPLGVTRGE